MIDRLNGALEGRYRVEREIGEGGMATVFLARDVRHDRLVAIKVLRPELAAVVGADRFLTEIRTTANLQHPHILPLHDSGEADGFLFYVMPFIQGESLRERLDREHQLPVDEALAIAAKVGAALAYAHEQGIVHRDVKPANILLSRGEPLVADFGIALAVSQAGGGRITETGLSLGTPHYMSPEQASGDRTVDARSDVYALACVLWEMLAGEPPYAGPTAQAVLARILTEDARPVSAVRRSVPAHVSDATARALEKLPADRFPSVAAFVRALGDDGFRHRTAGATRGDGDATEGAHPGVPRRWAVPGAVTVVGLAALAAWGWLRPTPPPPMPPPARLLLDLGQLEVASSQGVVISPDGTRLAVVGRNGSTGPRSIWVRRIDQAGFRELPGTEDADSPAFSPDGEWIVYRHDPTDALRKTSVLGGGALTLLDDPVIDPYEPHWGETDEVVFTGPDGLAVIPAEGGPVERVSGELDGLAPRLLPDGSILATEYGGSEIRLVDRETDSIRVLIPQGRFPRWVETGHIVYVGPSGGLFAVPYDLGAMETTGPPVPVLDGVASGASIAAWDVSRTGTLVYRAGRPTLGSGGARQFVLVDRTGRAETLPLPPRSLANPRISPDGRFVAYEGQGPVEGPNQVFTYELATGRTVQLTEDGDNDNPVWSPDGTRIIYDADGPDGGEDLFVVSATGEGAAETALELPGIQNAESWPREDVVTFVQEGESDDLWILDRSSGQPTAYLTAPWDEHSMAVSPDGSLAAYVSDETGSDEVWVRRFPEPEGKWRVSTDIGIAPRWSPDGAVLYYMGPGSGDARSPAVWAATVTSTDGGVEISSPEQLFSGPYERGQWDVHPDGERFLLIQGQGAGAEDATGENPEPVFLVVVNWFSELRQRLGGRG